MHTVLLSHEITFPMRFDTRDPVVAKISPMVDRPEVNQLDEPLMVPRPFGVNNLWPQTELCFVLWHRGAEAASHPACEISTVRKFGIIKFICAEGQKWSTGRTTVLEFSAEVSHSVRPSSRFVEY